MLATLDHIDAFAAYEAARTLSSRFEKFGDLDDDRIPATARYVRGGGASAIETSPRRITDKDLKPDERTFEELDTKRREQTSALVLYIRERLEWEERERLGDRLQYLTTPLEDEEDFVVPSPDSLCSFILFLERFKRLKYPNITLTHGGNIRAHWLSSKDQYVALEFLGAGQTRFVIFAPNPRQPGRTIRVAGTASTEWILDRNEQDLSWIVR